ncbi:alpha-keto acid decarboxylase family protein [Arcanobacterium ihumii]|uniref:alpha-keto acid decarboxylase family protein n=1 Tax=Arcanobacterium ihumii TaxID=2138162 RepID=UPI001358A7EC|nr:thiamine pyrophosphate-binding protein [Arcanobacterium ihumii]
MTTSNSPQSYTVGDYLLDRLNEIGIDELFGVPGDYNLHFLDHVIAHENIHWAGSANELNAGYSADGYARIKGIGALLTTYGVGELSATNAIAGSFAEFVPVVHIVGAPAKHIQAEHRRAHHSLGDGNFEHFARIAKEITCCVIDVEAPTASAQIDHALSQVLFHKRPGMIILAADVAASPATPPSTPLVRLEPVSSETAATEFEAELRNFIQGKKVTVLADILVHRDGAADQLRSFLDKTGLPVTTLSWGKSLVDESLTNYVGTYSGSASAEPVRVAVENADALMTIGVQFTDNTTGGFTAKIDNEHRIDLGRSEARIGNRVFAPLSIATSLNITEQVICELHVEAMPFEKFDSNYTPIELTDTPLQQDDLWQLVATHLNASHIVLAEQGTSFFGLSQCRFPQGVTFVGQPLWGSIGYTLPATVGAGLADRNKRPVLFIGDGSAQLTIQELGQMIREDIPAVVILINNDGYTVERAIHGMTASYNTIPAWRWDLALEFFGSDPTNHLVFKATTSQELDFALQTAMEHPGKLVLIEAVTDAQDIPSALDFVSSMG